MTEDEAKTKWCPFTRLLAGTRNRTSGAAFNRTLIEGHDEQFIGNCIGSACMAWRTQPHKLEHPDSWGFCGLAGAPQ